MKYLPIYFILFYFILFYLGCPKNALFAKLNDNTKRYIDT